MDDLEVKKLEEQYYDPAHPGAFSGSQKFFLGQTSTSASRKQVEAFLKSQETHTLHFPARVRFPRNNVVVGGINQLWDTDLLSMQNLADDNDAFNFILTSIDVLSKFAYCEKLKSKSARDVSTGFGEILKRAEARSSLPTSIRSDMGSEYNNYLWRRLMKQYGIKHYMTYNSEIKANFSEIFQKTLKRLIYKTMTRRKSRVWIGFLQDLVRNYNYSFHSTIKTSPASVRPGRVEELVWRRQYETKPAPKPDGAFRHKAGDLVRLSHSAKLFRREYHQKWTEELFRVTSSQRRAGLNVYRVEDVAGDAVLGTFYQKELQGVTVDLSGTFDVERVIRKKKVKGGRTMYLIRWKGYAAKFDSWLDEKDFVPGAGL